MELESEYIERMALQDLHLSATPEISRKLKLQSLNIGSALVSIAGSLPDSAIVINRSPGIGLASAETKESVDTILQAYRDAGVNKYFLHRHPDSQPAEIVDWFLSAGLVKARGWQKFRRGVDPAPSIETDLIIREIGPEYAGHFGTIAADAFDIGQAAAPWLGMLVGRPGWHIFMSFDGNTAAGVGAVFIRQGIAWMDFGATSPEFRCRGSQGALLARRIEYALVNGCRQIFTCTGEDIAGDPQHSYKNILRMGFSKDYLRENYAPVNR